MDGYAIYASRELRAVYYNGAGYVVREDMFPHTTWPGGQITTRQGHAMYTGVRQGLKDTSGFKVTRYGQPDIRAL